MPAKRGAKRPVHLPKSRLSTRKRSATKRSPRRNPGVLGTGSEVLSAFGGNGLVHAFGGYAGSRLAGRIVRNLLAAKFPNAVKHLGPVGNILAAVALYFIIKKTRKIRDEAMLGSAIAVIQSILQTYLPGLGAILLDSDGAVALPAPKPQGGLGAYKNGRRNGGTRFVVPGEIESARAEAALNGRGNGGGGTRYVNPGEPGAGYGSPADAQVRQQASTFEEETADVGGTGGGDDFSDFDQDDLGIFNQQ